METRTNIYSTKKYNVVDTFCVCSIDINSGSQTVVDIIYSKNDFLSSIQNKFLNDYKYLAVDKLHDELVEGFYLVTGSEGVIEFVEKVKKVSVGYFYNTIVYDYLTLFRWQLVECSFDVSVQLAKDRQMRIDLSILKMDLENDADNCLLEVGKGCDEVVAGVDDCGLNSFDAEVGDVGDDIEVFNLKSLTDYPSIFISGEDSKKCTQVARDILANMIHRKQDAENTLIITSYNKSSSYKFPKSKIIYDYNYDVINEYLERSGGCIVIDIPTDFHKNSFLSEIIYNHRYYKKSFIMTCKTVTKFSPDIRINIDFLFQFKDTDVGNQKKIYGTYNLDMSFGEFSDIFDNIDENTCVVIDGKNIYSYEL